jgi:hypothetical protein
VSRRRYPLPPGWRRVVWPLTGLLFVGAVAVVREGRLAVDVAPRGLIDLELASTQPRVNEIVAAWDARGVRGYALLITYLDVPFIVMYAAALGLSVAAAAEALRRRAWPLARVGRPLAWAQAVTLAAGLGENVGMLWQLHHAPAVGPPWARLTWLCSLCKWSLALGGGAYSLYGAGAWVAARLGPAEAG